jgi:hypothetical protein
MLFQQDTLQRKWYNFNKQLRTTIVLPILRDLLQVQKVTKILKEQYNQEYHKDCGIYIKNKQPKAKNK